MSILPNYIASSNTGTGYPERLSISKDAQNSTTYNSMEPDLISRLDLTLQSVLL